MLLVCYDIANNRRRYQVNKILCGYGERVQKSVFECYLTPTQRKTLKESLRRGLGNGDSIRFYSLCGKDIKRVQVDGVGHLSENWDYLVI